MKEIGVLPIQLTDAGKDDPLLQEFSNELEAFHWHSEMMGLTDGAEVLAETPGCPRQVVRFREDVYGFQCHFEMTRENVLELMENCDEEYSDAKGEYVQFPEEIFASDFSTMNTRMHFILDAFVQSLPLEVK
jgi:GMP synthase (glutamine-hydrolysing)